MNKLTGTIYGLICPIEHRIVYVGQTCHPLLKRLIGHKASKPSPSPLSKWIDDLFDKGLIDNLFITPLQENVPLDKLPDAEAFWISKLKDKGTLYNKMGKTNRTMQIVGGRYCGVDLKKKINTETLRDYKSLVISIGVKATAELAGISEQQVKNAIRERKCTNYVLCAMEKAFNQYTETQKQTA